MSGLEGLQVLSTEVAGATEVRDASLQLVLQETYELFRLLHGTIRAGLAAVRLSPCAPSASLCHPLTEPWVHTQPSRMGSCRGCIAG